MKNHIAIKFIAIVLCALCLLGAAGGEILPPFYCSRSPRLTFQNKRIQ